MNGTFVSLISGNITVRHVDKSVTTHALDSKAVVVVLNDSPAKLEDIRAGDEVALSGQPVVEVKAIRGANAVQTAEEVRVQKAVADRSKVVADRAAAPKKQTAAEEAADLKQATADAKEEAAATKQAVADEKAAAKEEADHKHKRGH